MSENLLSNLDRKSIVSSYMVNSKDALGKPQTRHVTQVDAFDPKDDAKAVTVKLYWQWNELVAELTDENGLDVFVILATKKER